MRSCRIFLGSDADLTKGHTGKFEFDDEADIFHGEVLDVRDVVTFQGRSAEELEQAFEDSVGDWLAFSSRPSS